MICIVTASAMVSGCRTENTKYPSKKGSLHELLYSPEKSLFSLWAPTADSAVVLIYGNAEDKLPYRHIYMNPDCSDGSWAATAEGDLNGKFYSFRILTDGKWLEETPGIFATAVGVNGKRAAVLDMAATDPEGWESDKSPALASLSDAIVYEMHHRDMSISPNSGITPGHRGRFLALTEENTGNGEGALTGLSHLKELGVTHVHILPSFDFASVDETRPEDNVYNWGYDPLNYNVPEGSYSTDPYDPGTRIREFKSMVQALHKAGIRVVMDVVYNHVADAASSPFERTAPGYFFRMNPDGTYANGSGCGNETASEKEMMRRYIVESVCWWAKEYHIDGFRFDLMGIHDIETMNDVRKALDRIDPTILVYGEGWAASAPLYDNGKLAMKANTSEMPRIAAFSDEMRDALRGPFSDDAKAGFLGGEPGMEESIKFGIAGAVNHPQIDFSKVNYSSTGWAGQPSQMMSYISCHDDMCLRDRLKASIPDISEEELIRLDKLGQTAVFTSQGIPFIYAGEEIFRTKKGVRNSFESPDDINAIDWSFKTRYAGLYEYYKGLIEFRKAHPAFRLGDADLVRRHLEFLDAPEGVVAFRLNGHAGGDPCEEIVVILNSRKEAVEITVPETDKSGSGNGNYTVYCTDGRISTEGLGSLTGPTVTAGPQQALIIGK